MLEKSVQNLYRYRFTILVFLVLVYRSSSMTLIKQIFGITHRHKQTRVIIYRDDKRIDLAGINLCGDIDDDDGCADPYEDDDDNSYDDDGCSGCEDSYESDYDDDDYDDGCEGCTGEYEEESSYDSGYEDEGCEGCSGEAAVGSSYDPPITIQKTIRFRFAVQGSKTVVISVRDLRGDFQKELSRAIYAPGSYVVDWYGYMDLDDSGRRIHDGTYVAELIVENVQGSASFQYSEIDGFSVSLIEL